MKKQNNSKDNIYSPYQLSANLDDKFCVTFWKLLFIPDVIVKLIFYFGASHREYLMSHFISYWLITILVIITCIYFPIIYVLTWKLANRDNVFPSWSVLAKIYIILSASISNSAFIIVGGARFFS